METGQGKVKAVHTSFRILETIRERNGAGITEIANETSITKSTVFRHLQTLEEDEYVVKENDTYHIGLRLLGFGDQVRTRKTGYDLAQKKVEELADETDERAQFMVEEYGNVYYLHQETGRHAVHLHRSIGDCIPVHRASAGKAMLAEYPDEKIHDICERYGLERGTEHSITDRDKLFEEIEQIRERGYSYNRQENSEGIRAVGVAVKSPAGGVFGALSIAGPTHRLKGDLFEQELPDLLLGAANELELNIKHA
ncbi:MULTISPECIES: IclR family transcriptional regulator [Salinibaculum]|uniref:IclR family transcriptional regulator n=1 Tax=Salinibaculum TaxID=2732368 RepID=UPI0030D5C802